MPDLPGDVPIRRALLSVSDKTQLEFLARTLVEAGVEILSTGGTAMALRNAGIEVVEVADHTGFPEMLDGRVKTLHPVIHGGLLGRREDPAHVAAMKEHGIDLIDLVAINLYPFEETVRSGAAAKICIENIDIGGPAMIRSAAKNHASVVILVDPADYAEVMEEMCANEGALGLETRVRLAAKAYARTAAYDSAVSAWFREQDDFDSGPWIGIGGERITTLRYGENPHQQAALYRSAGTMPGVATATQIQGRELSFNNLLDADAAFGLATDIEETAVVIVKHTNPAGVACAGTPLEAWHLALRCDPVSAFGGIVALNRPLDGETARALSEIFIEVVIAPEVSDEAREVLAAKKNLRLLSTEGMPPQDAPGLDARTLAGGLLVQTKDRTRTTPADLRTVTKRKPNTRETADLLFASLVCKHVKSNAIVYAKDGATVGIGAGQMSRIDSSQIATMKAQRAAEEAGIKELLTKGSVIASDAFFPFPDGLLAALDAGATAVVQPGGSVRDEEVIAAADERGAAMVFTGTRHFRH